MDFRTEISLRSCLPSRDDIVMDMKTDQVIIKGPMTKEEKVEWDRWRERIKEHYREIEKTDRSAQRLQDKGRQALPTGRYPPPEATARDNCQGNRGAEKRRYTVRRFKS
jgi:ferric-dicitrate binding protein FerR (iron transport regulator)